MSALESLRRVLVEVGVDYRDSALSVSDPDTFDQLQVIHFMEQAGRDAAQRAEWPALRLTYDIPQGMDELTVINFGITPYQDFRTFGTGANVVTTLGPARVILNPTTWDDLRDQDLDSPYVFVDGEFTLRSTVSLRGAKVGYFSWGWVSHGVVRSRRLMNDDDTFLLPEHIIELGGVWRWKRSKGRPYEGELKEFEAEIALNARNAKAAV